MSKYSTLKKMFFIGLIFPALSLVLLGLAWVLEFFGIEHLGFIGEIFAITMIVLLAIPLVISEVFLGLINGPILFGSYQSCNWKSDGCEPQIIFGYIFIVILFSLIGYFIDRRRNRKIT